MILVLIILGLLIAKPVFGADLGFEITWEMLASTTDWIGAVWNSVGNLILLIVGVLLAAVFFGVIIDRFVK